MNDPSVKVTADTEEFIENIERATEAINEFQNALDELEETPVSLEIITCGERSVTRLEMADDAKRGLADALESNNVSR